MTTATTTLPTLASAQSAEAEAAAQTAAGALPPFALTGLSLARARSPHRLGW